MGNRSKQSSSRTASPDRPDAIVIGLGVASALVLVAAALFALGLFSDGEPDTVRVDGPITSVPTDATTAPVGAPAPCDSTHAGHNVMRWNATMADEMVTAGCGWPYEPFTVPLEGGEEDPALDAPFEARLYSEIWDAIGQVDVGVCAVSALPEEPGEGGFVFGFDYGIAEPGCANDAIAHVVVKEYGTRAQRDAAAHASDEAATYVLGRWVVTVFGEEQSMTDALEQAVDSLGAVPVGR